ncbi:MAG: hypothetical protein Q4P06_01755 [Actinomycetaceae bacterium]|nr:hypothetical protein [Actinomycetaceae bacterium]
MSGQSAFQHLAVAGKLGHSEAGGNAPGPSLTAQGLKEQLSDGQVKARVIRVEPDELESLLTWPDRLISYEQLPDLQAWAPPGATTYLVARHEDPRVAPPWGSLGALLESWAGTAGRGAGTGQVEQVLSRARERIGNRRLRVLTTTDRPLLGLSSAVSMTPQLMPVTVTEEYLRSLKVLGEALSKWDAKSGLAQITSGSGPHRLPVQQSPALRSGSGTGWGIGLLAPAVGGQVLDAWETMMQLNAASLQAPTDLVVALTGPLHSHTVAYSPIPVLGQWAQQQAVPFVVFTHESTISRYEVAQWAVTNVYHVSGRDDAESVQGILARTWLRKC